MSRLNTKRDKGAGSIFKKGGKVKRKIGKDTAAKIDASDTYPVKIIVIIDTTKQNGNAVGNNAINNVKIQMSSGNMTTGVFTLYGLVK